MSRFKRRFGAPAMALALTIALLAGVLHGAALYKEDINADGRVNILDVVTLLLIGKADPADPRADFNGDAVWSSKDATDLMTNIRQGTLTPLPPSAPQIALSVDSLVFGEVLLGESLSDTLTVYNLGSQTLTVSGVSTSDSAFTVSPDTATVGPGLVAHLIVTFRPDAPGPLSATLSILSNDPALPALPVKVLGSGIAPPAPRIVLSTDSLAFGNVNVGSSQTLNFNISNQGNASLAVSKISSSNTVYSIAPTNLTVSPAQSGTIEVTFRPTAAGAVNAVLSIISNDLAADSLTLKVSGSGVAVVVNKTHVVLMPGNVFSPKDLTIAVGDTVSWNNNDTRAHTVTSGTNGVANGIFNSNNMNSGQTFTYVFTVKGTFPYYCLYHYLLGMTGTITVQ